MKTRLLFRLRIWRDDQLTCDMAVDSRHYHLLCAVRECQEISALHRGQKLKIFQTTTREENYEN